MKSSDDITTKSMFQIIKRIKDMFSNAPVDVSDACVGTSDEMFLSSCMLRMVSLSHNILNCVKESHFTICVIAYKRFGFDICDMQIHSKLNTYNDCNVLFCNAYDAEQCVRDNLGSSVFYFNAFYKCNPQPLFDWIVKLSGDVYNYIPACFDRAMLIGIMNKLRNSYYLSGQCFFHKFRNYKLFMSDSICISDIFSLEFNNFTNYIPLKCLIVFVHNRLFSNKQCYISHVFETSDMVKTFCMTVSNKYFVSDTDVYYNVICADDFNFLNNLRIDLLHVFSFQSIRLVNKTVDELKSLPDISLLYSWWRLPESCSCQVTQLLSSFCEDNDCHSDFSGIYIVYNVSLTKYYVGQGKSAVRRCFSHFIKGSVGKDNCCDLFLDWDSGDKFAVGFIRLVDTSYDSLDTLEDYYIEKLDCVRTGYNSRHGNSNILS